MILVTGGNGYVGRAAVRALAAQGHPVAFLGSAPPGADGTAHRWRLGEVPPAAAFQGVTGVLHLAHDWTATDARNREGTLALAAAAAAAGVRRFVFVSTTSARPEALNRYGRGKWELEEALRSLAVGTPGMEVTAARIALVYGGPPQGQYRLMLALTRALPLLPMIGLHKEIQPVHLEETARGLAAMLDLPPPVAPVYVLGDPAPLRFGQWLRLLRRAQTGRGLVLLPIPLGAALFGCRVLARIPFLPKVDEERILGLAGATPMSSGPSLAALGLEIEPVPRRLVRELAPRRTRLAEATTLLRYVRAPVHAGTLRRLVRGLEQEAVPLLGLGRLVRALPGLIRFLEPPASDRGHRFAQALHLAALVAEAELAPGRPAPPATGPLLADLVLDALALPVRMVWSRFTR